MATRWKFQTRNFRVELETTRVHGFQYDGEDEDGETQAALDCGEFVAFDSAVHVYLRGEDSPLGSDYLGSSVYAADSIAEFWQSHRTSSEDGRNTLAQKERRVVVCHYFPEMVRQAIAAARDEITSRKAAAAALPYIRESI